MCTQLLLKMGFKVLERDQPVESVLQRDQITSQKETVVMRETRSNLTEEKHSKERTSTAQRSTSEDHHSLQNSKQLSRLCDTNHETTAAAGQRRVLL